MQESDYYKVEYLVLILIIFVCFSFVLGSAKTLKA
jgi:hypothetical protein